MVHQVEVSGLSPQLFFKLGKLIPCNPVHADEDLSISFLNTVISAQDADHAAPVMAYHIGQLAD